MLNPGVLNSLHGQTNCCNIEVMSRMWNLGAGALFVAEKTERKIVTLGNFTSFCVYFSFCALRSQNCD